MSDYSKLLSNVDGPVDAAFASVVRGLFEQIESARDVLSESGAVLQNPDGSVRESAAARVERAASAELRGWLKDRPELFEAPAGSRGRGRFGGLRSVQ